MSERIVTPEWIAIERSWCAIGVATPANMLHALDEVERLTAAVERVRALHVRVQGKYFPAFCEHCDSRSYPCDTIAALEGTP